MAHNGRQKADAMLAAALAAGKTIREASRAHGLSERTAARRWADPSFRSLVSSLQGEMIGRALGQMADGMSQAALVLKSLLTAESESVRLSAARCLLDLGTRLRESVTLEQRLSAIEAWAERKGINP